MGTRPTCSNNGCPNLCKKRIRNGVVTYSKTCESCGMSETRYNKKSEYRKRTTQLGSKQRKYSGAVKSKKVCERCGFIPELPIQLEIHHRDGVHSNNTPDNLQVLCRNCHGYITYTEKHGIYRQRKNRFNTGVQ